MGFSLILPGFKNDPYPKKCGLFGQKIWNFPENIRFFVWFLSVPFRRFPFRSVPFHIDVTCIPFRSVPSSFFIVFAERNGTIKISFRAVPFRGTDEGNVVSRTRYNLSDSLDSCIDSCSHLNVFFLYPGSYQMDILAVSILGKVSYMTECGRNMCSVAESTWK